MRLVKALRRRIAVARAIAFVGLLPVGCVEDCGDDDDDGDDHGDALTAADCAPTLRLPVSPRIMEVLDDGSVHAGPPCASANCLAGAEGAWGFRDGTSTKIDVGAQHLELAAPIEGSARSRFAAQHAVRGFVVGRNVAVIDRGSELEIVTPDATRRVLAPTLRDGELVHAVWRDHESGEVFLWARAPKRGARGRVIALQAERTPPRLDAVAVGDERGAHVGWLLPSRNGEPAVVVRNSSGGRDDVVTLAVDAPADISSAQLLAGRFVVRVAKRGFVLAADGSLVVELPSGFEVTAHNNVLYAINERAPGGFHLVGAHGLEPLLVPRARTDLAGAPLPAGAQVERVEIAMAGTRALVVERVRLSTCTVEDKLVLVDLQTKTARTLASGDVVRLHPMLAGDRFRFVEADASYDAR